MSTTPFNVKLGEVAEINPKLPEALSNDAIVSFLPMSAVSTDTATTTADVNRPYADVCKGYTPFLNGDVLVAKITPCFENGKIAQASLRNEVGFGSTEFHVLRPRPDQLNARYLLHYLRQGKIRRDGERKMTGSGGQRRVPEYFLANLVLPLPPLSEQGRIVEVLDNAEELRAKRRAALAKIHGLTLSIFLDMFGDPKSNPKGWPIEMMGELLAESPIFGTMIPPKAEKLGSLSLRVGNIRDWNLDLRDKKYVDLPLGSVERHTVKDGDILLARAIASQDHLGKCIVAYPSGDNWAFDSHLMRLRFDRTKAEPEFIRQLLMTPGGRSLFLSASRKSTVQFNINTKEISTLRIPVPPVDCQREFSDSIAVVAKLKAAHYASLTELDALFASLQHRAFRGEL